MTAAIGRPVARVDGTAKVTGARPLHRGDPAARAGARGDRRRDDPQWPGARRSSAGPRAADGRAGRAHTPQPGQDRRRAAAAAVAGRRARRRGESFFPMQDDLVHYAGQPVAIVVADSLERAQYAASLVRIRLRARRRRSTTIDEGRDDGVRAGEAVRRADARPHRARRRRARRSRGADVRVDRTYRMAANHHNPHRGAATTAVWDDDRLTIYDSTMGIRASQLTVAHLLGLPLAAGPRGHALRRRQLRRARRWSGRTSRWPRWPPGTSAGRSGWCSPARRCSPRTATARSRSSGSRSAPTRDGRLTAMRHEKLSITSPFDDWAEPATGVSSQLYACPNFEGVHRLIRGNTMTPTFTRGPGESTGRRSCWRRAMDELAHAARHRPGRAAPAQPRRRRPAAATPGRATGCRSACAAAPSGSAGPTATRRRARTRDGDWLIGTGHGGRRLPGARCSCPSSAPGRGCTPTAARSVEAGTQEFGTGVATR